MATVSSKMRQNGNCGDGDGISGMKIVVGRRRFAKRQLTWFKSIENRNWLTPDYNFEEVVDYINSLINN